MPIDLTVLARRLEPEKTILLFGAGSSIPSGGPSGDSLGATLAKKFGIELSKPMALADLATVIEAKHHRRPLIEAIGQVLRPLRPTRGILNLPDFEWAGLYTTNFDQLIEKAYVARDKSLNVIASNFDFGRQPLLNNPPLYKLHGTIDFDTSLGHQHRLVVTAADYDFSSEFREGLYVKFSEQLFNGDAVIIGHSLSDPDLRAIVEAALRVKRMKGAPGRIVLLAYEQDENQALIYESRGLEVCFAGIDEFFGELTKKLAAEKPLPGFSDNPLDRARAVLPSTTVVSWARANQTGNLSRMFNGSPANYADVMRGWTFERDFSDRLETQLADPAGKRIAYVLGPAGSGKSTGIKKALVRLIDRGIECWEHVNDFSLLSEAWTAIDDELRRRKQTAVLFIDDAHEHLHEVNSLVDNICKSELPALKLVIASSKPNWNPRLKSPSIFSKGSGYELGTLSARELDSLLNTLEANKDVAALVEQNFLGFNRAERLRRLLERCRSDMFVCMKNIFASESFDEILLREYAELSGDHQSIYRRIAGMESAGIRVHRQLVLRALGIQASQVGRYLDDLEGIVEEVAVSERLGIFAWRVRHSVIAEIIAKHKFTSPDEYFAFLDHTISNLNPSYEIEISSMNDICDPQGGLSRILDRRKQNVLLRKMISLAPSQRVPRHRLITNLIALSEYETASTEIRLFENELRSDGPVNRYKILLMLERAKRSEGLMPEDRIAMIREASALAEASIERFRDDKNLYRVYLEVGVALLKYEPNREIFDRAMELANDAYARILDPDLARTIRHFEWIEQRFTS